MDILILDPFYEYSHRVWAEGLQKHSTHQIKILSLSPHHWKWRMTGGAVELAEQYKNLNENIDLILATDMLDFNAFLSLAKIDRNKIATGIYFHENQITYPWNTKESNEQKERNHHYGFINFTSCLVADRIFFNSDFHKEAFLNALPSFLKIFPSFGHQKYTNEIVSKSTVLPIGLDLQLNTSKTKNNKSETPCFLWNHRWEHDKNPELFFKTLYQLKEENIPFELIVLGKSYERQPAIFQEAKQKLKEEIVHFGYEKSFTTYQELLSRANILMVTSNQDFFGISIVEGISAGLYPILPHRLAYPEHIALERKKEVFYYDDQQLFSLVMQVISEEKYKEENTFAAFVQKYDWPNLIEDYDQAFQDILKINC